MSKQSNEAIQMGPEKALRSLQFMIKNKLNMMLVGAPGTAKTALVYKAAELTDHEVIVFHPVISDPTNFTGMPAIMKYEVPNEAEGKETRFLAQFVPFESLKRLLIADKPTVAFADDLGQAPRLVQAAWMQLVLARKLDDKNVSPYITFVSASNRKEDKAGVTGILEPLKSRFVSIIELVPVVEDWLTWARDEGKVHPYIRAFVRMHGINVLWEFAPTNDMTNSICPRTIEHASKIMWGKPDIDLRHTLLAGAAGQAWASEFETFIQVIKDLPKMSAIAKNPEKCPVPPAEQVSSQYIIIEAMIDKTSKKVIEPFLTYIKRFPKEFQQWYISQIKETCPEALKTSAYTNWVTETGIE